MNIKSKRGKLIQREDIIKEVKLPSPYNELFTDSTLKRVIAEQIMDTIVDHLKEGHKVDLGVGKMYLKMRRNNQVLNEGARKYSMVLRGDVNRNIEQEILDKCEENEELYEVFDLKNKD